MKYRGYTITYDPPPIPLRTMDWHFVHKDYDGAEDANDQRGGHGSSVKDCKAQIDEIEDEGAFADVDEPERCKDCGAPVDGDGYSIGDRACRYCAP